MCVTILQPQPYYPLFAVLFYPGLFEWTSQIAQKVVDVIVRGQGICDSKLTESKGEAREQGLFTAINPWQPIL